MDLKQAIQGAMRGEVEGRELYLAIASKTDDVEARKVFEHLAEEEDRHFQYLKALYGEFLDGEKVDFSGMKKVLSAEQVTAPIFSASFKERVSGKHFEMSALSIAMKLEKDAVQAYADMAEAADSEEVRNFFLELSSWENTHYEMMARAIEELSDDYYNSNYFAPF
jgi:rubrerythrin